MSEIKKQLYESFYQSIFQILPILVFVFFDILNETVFAYVISILVLSANYFYIFFKHRNLLNWFGFSIILYIAFIGIFNCFDSIHCLRFLSSYQNECSILFILGIILIFRKKIKQSLVQLTLKKLPMVNNNNELIANIRFVFILTFFVFILEITAMSHNMLLVKLAEIKLVYASIIILYAIYQLIRVKLIRYKLRQEEWWPILNEQGSEIGSIQNQESLVGEIKHIHPVVRLVLINDCRILLQKKIIYADPSWVEAWDTSVIYHIRMGESIEECLQRALSEDFGLRDVNYMYLSKYLLELPRETQYAFFFILCNIKDIKPNRNKISNVKWWTLPQIEANLNDSVFSDSFRKEFELLKRSGIFGEAGCNCDCKLKDTILGK